MAKHKDYIVEINWRLLKVKTVKVKARNQKEARKLALESNLTGVYKGRRWCRRIGGLPFAEAVAVWNARHEIMSK